MSSYRLFLLDDADEVTSVQEITAACDSEAMQRAKGLRTRPPAVDVWQRARWIGLVRNHQDSAPSWGEQPTA